jgi:hypothetical protein
LLGAANNQHDRERAQAGIGRGLVPAPGAHRSISAPSVALATLMLAFAKDGSWYAATESRSMMIGAAGLVAYSSACAWAVARPGVPVWASTGLCWLAWLMVTFGLFGVLIP